MSLLVLLIIPLCSWLATQTDPEFSEESECGGRPLEQGSGGAVPEAVVRVFL